MEKTIGGYFGWEFPLQKFSFPNETGLLLNNNRSALQVILSSLGNVSKVYVPYYTCDSVSLALDAIHINYQFYSINKDLELDGKICLHESEYLIYVNYFGIKDAYCKDLAELYGNQLIVDNAQAFYADHIRGTHSAYSARKFVGVPDGGIAVSDCIKNTEYPPASVKDRCGALVARADGDVAAGYQLFQENDKKFRDDGVQGMSVVTKRILHSFDHDRIIKQRRVNYSYLAEALGEKNVIELPSFNSFKCPMVYPFMTKDESFRSKLIDNSVFVARYWPNVLDWCDESTIENYLCRHIIPMPIDQRYGREDMKHIVKLINELL